MMQLIHIFTPVFTYVCQTFQQPEREISMVEFRQTCTRKIEQALEKTMILYSETEAMDALYAVVVWLDEYVMRAAEDWAAEWRRSLLQYDIFRSSVGGEEFYFRLDNLAPESLSVRMVYLHCLLFGFEGKFADNSETARRKYISELQTMLPAEWCHWPTTAVLTPLPEQGAPSAARKRWKKGLIVLLPIVFYIAILCLGFLFLIG